MAKSGKKYQEACKLVEAGKLYTAAEAMDLVKKTATAKFDESIELHVRLGVDPKYPDQQVRGAIVLPNGTGKTKRVLVFAKGEKVKEAEAAGADFVGSDEIVQKIQGGWLDVDVAVAPPDMMGTVGDCKIAFRLFVRLAACNHADVWFNVWELCHRVEI